MEYAKALERLARLREAVAHLRGTARAAVERELALAERSLKSYEVLRKVGTPAALARAATHLDPAVKALDRAASYAGGVEEAIARRRERREPAPGGPAPTEPGRMKTLDEMRNDLRRLEQERIEAENAGELRKVNDLSREIGTLSDIIIRRSPIWQRGAARAWDTFIKHPVAYVIGFVAFWWALLSGKLTSFPAFIFEEAIQQAAFNLFGLTDRNTIERVTDPTLTSDEGFAAWLAETRAGLDTLQKTVTAAKSYNESLWMAVAPLAKPSYEKFVETAEVRITGIQDQIQKAINTRTRRKAGEAVSSWDEIDAQKEVKAGFDPLIGLGMQIDALIKSRLWPVATNTLDRYGKQLQIAEKAYRDSFTMLDEGWRAVYQGQLDSGLHRITGWEEIIRVQGEAPEEEPTPTTAAGETTEQAIARIKAQREGAPAPAGGAAPTGPRAPVHGGGLTESERILLGK